MPESYYTGASRAIPVRTACGSGRALYYATSTLIKKWPARYRRRF